MDLSDKQFAVIQGNAGALDFVRKMRDRLDDKDYERWLDTLIEEEITGTVLYGARYKVAARIEAEWS